MLLLKHVMLGLQGSQEFKPESRQLVNFGSLLGGLASVSADGTYELVEKEVWSLFYHPCQDHPSLTSKACRVPVLTGL